MQSLRFPRFTEIPWRSVAFLAAGLYACSFQDFGYLKEGEDSVGRSGAGSAGVGDTGPKGGQAGSEETAFDAGQGGAPVSGGGEGGSLDAGSGGDSADSAGSGGSGEESAGSGGAGPAGGTGTAGTGGVPVQRELLNPSFEQYLTGWIVAPPEAASNHTCVIAEGQQTNKPYVFAEDPSIGSGTAAPNGGVVVLKSWHECESYDFELYQALSGLEPGTYTLRAYFSSDRNQGQGAYLFARNCGGQDQMRSTAVPIPTNGPGGAWDWSEVVLAGIEVADPGTCEVGFHVNAHAKPDWLNADAFSFVKDPETESSDPR